MELVYPIYLDVPMMTGFLASLEDGIIEEAELENRLGDSSEKSGSTGAKLGSSGLLRGLLDISAGAEGAKKVAESVESSYRGIIRYPTSALFIRLRRLLTSQEGQVKSLSNSLNLASIKPGDIVEFSGTVKAHPAHQIQSTVDQFLPILSSFMKIGETAMEGERNRIQNSGVGSGQQITFQEQVYPFQNKKDKDTLLAIIDSQKANTIGQVRLFETMGEVVSSLLHQDIWNTVVVELGGWKAICRIYPSFIRNERVEELHDAYWTCMGKVIGTIQLGETFDLLKGMPIGHFAKGQFNNIASTLNTEELSIETNESEIKGPALIIAVMAIYS